jgi:predicted  nucleic acid-binding Zn-ribbon protein
MTLRDIELQLAKLQKHDILEVWQEVDALEQQKLELEVMIQATESNLDDIREEINFMATDMMDAETSREYRELSEQQKELFRELYLLRGY